MNRDPFSSSSLASRFVEVRATTGRLAEPLSAEDCAAQSMPDASPVKWHLAHTTWFFETFVLENAEPDFRPFHPRFRMLFNSYYNALGPRHARPERGLLTRPALEEVRAFRRQVDQRMLRLLGAAAPDARIAELTELGLHHEQQHQELILTDVKHLLSCNPLEPAYVTDARPSAAAAPRAWHAYGEGVHEIGHAGAGFAFDNERPRHREYLDGFELASRPVTNGEFSEFVADGGYQRPDLWLSDGWDMVCAQAWNAPLYWALREGQWRQFTLAGVQPVDPAAPVCHVSYYEADAYARWAGCRLPSEAEWERAAAGAPVLGNFVENRALHPRTADHGDANGMPSQLYGDVWEWTRSAYSPYPGFRPAAGAVGEYNGKFMCNQFVLRGGSCATPRSHMRATYRNFFVPSARWQFSGIRLARDAR